MILPTSVRNAVGLDSACLTRYETPPTLFNAALIISLMSRVSLFGAPLGLPFPAAGGRVPLGTGIADSSYRSLICWRRLRCARLSPCAVPPPLQTSKSVSKCSFDVLGQNNGQGTDHLAAITAHAEA